MASNTSEEEWKRKFSQYIRSGKDSISILTCGNMGAGKSSMVNALIGKDMAREGMSPNPVTMATKAYEMVIVPRESNPEGRRITVTVWDTPGFGGVADYTPNAPADEATIKEKVREADFVLYCMDMRQRLPIEGIGVLQLTKLCGPEVWQNAVIALTFANEIHMKPGNDDQDNAEYFRKLFLEWKEAIVKLLTTQTTCSSDTTQAIPIVPVGYRETPPPGYTDWLSPFWEAAFNRTKARAQPSLLHVNIDRVRGGDYQTRTHDTPLDQQREAHELSIHFTPEFLVGEKGSHEAMKVAGAAGAGGAVIGAGIGALVGVLIGLAGGIFAPVTVPLAAGVGAFSGGAIGAASMGGLAGLIQKNANRNAET